MLLSYLPLECSTAEAQSASQVLSRFLSRVWSQRRFRIDGAKAV